MPNCDISPLVTCGPNMGSWQGSVFGFSNTIIGVAAFVAPIIVGAALLAGARFSSWFWWLFNLGNLGGIVFVFWLSWQSVFRLGHAVPVVHGGVDGHHPPVLGLPRGDDLAGLGETPRREKDRCLYQSVGLGVHCLQFFRDRSDGAARRGLAHASAAEPVKRRHSRSTCAMVSLSLAPVWITSSATRSRSASLA